MKYRLFVIILMLAACGFSTSDSMSLPRVELDVNMCVTNIRDELYVITVLTNTSDTVLNLDVEYSGLKGVLHQNPYTVRVSGKEIHSVSGGPLTIAQKSLPHRCRPKKFSHLFFSFPTVLSF